MRGRSSGRHAPDPGGREPAVTPREPVTVRELDPRSLPAPARWVLVAETRLRSAELPPALRRDDDPSTPSRAFLLAVMLGVGGVTAFVLAGLRQSPGLAIALAPVAVVLWAGTIVALEPGRLARPRLGPWLPAASAWLGVLFVLEVLVRGWASPRVGATVLQTALAGAAGLVAWGKARLDHES